MRFTFLLCLLVLCIHTGCTSQKALVDDIDQDVRTLDRSSLCGTLTDVSIKDRRSNVTERSLKMPIISFPAQADTVRPALRERHIDRIEQEIRSRTNAESSSYTATVTVLEGQKTFDAGWFTEGQGARWTTRVQLDGPGPTAQGDGQAQYAGRLIDASHDFANTLSGKTLHSSVAQATDEALNDLPDEARACAD